ncbi:MAG: transposase [Spirochaetae bacterium HGW-Spirochaetae-3]|jgi:putative transposase|nr:MAG: transposase [Spirochaetae bacterium HGW-Spirochaetae-3]
MRKRRHLVRGACYHVTMRANRKEMILDAPGIKALYIQVVREARLRYRFRIDNFTIMGNHVHLLIKPEENECLSRIMQWINSVFAIRYNKLFGLCGHVWGERFYSLILARLQDYIRVFKYIDENPVAAHLVLFADKWVFGGLFHSRKGIWTVLSPPTLLLCLLFPRHLPNSLMTKKR